MDVYREWVIGFAISSISHRMSGSTDKTGSHPWFSVLVRESVKNKITDTFINTSWLS